MAKGATGEQITVRISSEQKARAEHLLKVIAEGDNDLARVGVTITQVYRLAIARGLEALSSEFLKPDEE
jgi:hypothetical protein